MSKALKNKVKLNSIINVMEYGAKGDGSTDDTAALLSAVAALTSNKSLFFPAGDYIVNSGCILIRGKNNIKVFGEGKATRLRPSSQGPTGVKQDYHSTFAIDQCSNVTVSDMVIESKGENYGNTDAYGGLSGGDPRTNAIVNYGGSAVVVARSSNVNLKNIDGRYAGSVGVFYLSSSQDVVVENCFANAKSLGYAGFAVDNWADSAINTKRTYKFIDCRTAKEEATYACKSGIAAEGDEVTGRVLNVEVIGGIFEDSAIGGDSPTLGSGISAYETRLSVTSLVVKNCYTGVTFVKRGGAVDSTWCRLSDCQFTSNGVTGVHVTIGSATGGADVTVNNCIIRSAPTSVWSGVGAVTNQSVKVSSGIVTNGFVSGEVNIVDCDISGGQYGVYTTDKADIYIDGGKITGSVSAIQTYGGGRLEVNGASIRHTSGTKAITRTTANFAASASYPMMTYVTNNKVTCVNTSDTVVELAGNSALFSETIIKNNTSNKGGYTADKGFATTYDVDFPITWAPVVAGGTTAGVYEINSGASRATAVRSGKMVTVNAYIQLAAAITGGGTGDLIVSGLPFPKRSNSAAFGSVAYSSVDYTVSKQLTCYFGTLSTSSSILFWETADNAAVTLVPISSVSASDIVAFSITYEVD